MNLHELNGKTIGMVMVMIVSPLLAGAPPPPPSGGGGIKPPDTPPPGGVYFEDNVVVVGPGFVKPDSDSGTLYVQVPTVNNPSGANPSGGKTVSQILNEVASVKAQIEAASVEMPQGLLDPTSLLKLLEKGDLKTLFDDPEFLHEEAGGPEPASSDRTETVRSGGVAIKADPNAPAPARIKRGGPGAAVIPSYWQLPIR